MIAGTTGRFRFAPLLAATVITVLLLWMVGHAADIFLLLFLAILISLYLGAVTDFFQRRARLPRWAAFMLALFGTLGAIVGLFWLLVPPVIAQTQELLTVLPKQIEGWEQGIDRMMSNIPALQSMWHPGEHKLLIAAYEQVSGSFGSVVPKVFSLVHAAISVFSVLVMSIYLALEPAFYREYLIALFPPVHRDLVRDVLTDLGSTLRQYIVGQLFTMAMLALLTAIGFYFLKVPYWLTFSILTGAVAVVPFFGTLVSTALPALFMLGDRGFGGAMAVVAWGVVVHLFEGNVLMPKVMQGKVHLPPVMTILSVLIMGTMIGGVGLVVAVPALAVVMVVVRRILMNRIYEGKGFRRVVRDRLLVVRVPVPDGNVLVPTTPTPDVVGFRERALARMADLANRRAGDRRAAGDSAGD
ncbi:MAG: AI-2E family transporter [Gemmatimonadaceae bacterium]|nr:AI-2E family transporter [Gemmatimonadaceae bacterium]NUQ92992.1 AI-2E family transporter [Gemmatimonadaceae bacterium]NUR19034.1 AI-2E family transporter [Gemmatimonadaceae bacterium]NUS97157.1 AI-2E family transporter [Gemmatimonadaceae bacterium]